MSEQWGTYTRTGAEGQADDEVVLQADPQNRKRYEMKGFKFTGYRTNPFTSAQVGLQNQDNLAINVIQGRQVSDQPSVDDAQVVKEAMEVALRKMTGTWTDAEQIAAYQVHKEGHLLPEESDEMLTGDPTAGYDAIAPKLNSGELLTPLQEAQAPYVVAGPAPSEAVGVSGGTDGTSTSGAGTDGSGTTSPTPTTQTATTTNP